MNGGTRRARHTVAVIHFMKLSDPINIMLDCCIPDKKRLFAAIGSLNPGDVLQVEIDNCVSSKAMVETFVKNKWCRIVKVEEGDDFTILHIQMTVDA